MVQSRTGSGKTAAFGIPFANGIVNGDDKFVQAIVLLPTRELALQVAAELAKICQYRQMTVVPVYGGAPMGRQVEQLRAGGQIVCGTPGRVLDHLRRGTLKLDRVRCAVLDECDEMLSMGFQEDIESILEKTPTTRQTLLFSATVPEGIQRLARRFLRSPEFLKLSGDYVSVHDIRHVYYSIPGIQREQELLRILDFEEPKSAIIFCNTREETGRVAAFLRGKGHDAEAISSDLSQSDRERVLGRMRQGGIKFLVATDVAARGIDIENLSHVFNYTFPEAPEIYIHRTGRTGRAGRKGTAISLIGPTEVGSFYYLKLLYKIKPEERSLPSEAEIRSHREGERVQVLRRALEGDPGAEWRALARRLVSAVDGERLVAALLAHSYASVEGMPVVAKPRPVASPVGERRAAAGRGGRAARGRARTRRGPRSLSGPRPGPAALRWPRTADRGIAGGRGEIGIGRASAIAIATAAGHRPRRRRDRRRGDDGRLRRAAGDDHAGRRHERRPPPPLRNDQPPAEREFWEVWSEEKAQQADGGAGQAPAPQAAPTPTPAPFESTSPGIGEGGQRRRAEDRRGPPVPEPGPQGRRLREGDPRPAVDLRRQFDRHGHRRHEHAHVPERRPRRRRADHRRRHRQGNGRPPADLRDRQAAPALAGERRPQAACPHPDPLPQAGEGDSTRSIRSPRTALQSASPVLEVAPRCLRRPRAGRDGVLTPTLRGEGGDPIVRASKGERPASSRGAGLG